MRYTFLTLRLVFEVLLASYILRGKSIIFNQVMQVPYDPKKLDLSVQKGGQIAPQGKEDEAA